LTAAIRQHLALRIAGNRKAVEAKFFVDRPSLALSEVAHFRSAQVRMMENDNELSSKYRWGRARDDQPSINGRNAAFRSSLEILNSRCG